MILTKTGEDIARAVPGDVDWQRSSTGLLGAVDVDTNGATLLAGREVDDLTLIVVG